MVLLNVNDVGVFFVLVSGTKEVCEACMRAREEARVVNRDPGTDYAKNTLTEDFIFLIKL